jgi:hypothetical protein
MNLGSAHIIKYSVCYQIKNIINGKKTCSDWGQVIDAELISKVNHIFTLCVA